VAVTHLRLIKSFPEAGEDKPADLKPPVAEADLRFRLLRAFAAISAREDQLEVVRMAEALVDPIWDY
jgi:hypothetical protein